jgi:xanthine dehydrogenase accessory factor
VDGWEVVEEAGRLARAGEEFALATVVWRQGPSSGQQGARAIITAAGEVFGWIGGACAEPVVIGAARQAIGDGQSRLLLLGASGQFAGAVPEGMTVVPISCQSEGALEVFVEPVRPTPHLVVVGRSPMAHTLADLARDVGWEAELRDAGEFTASDVRTRSMVVVATQGHGDEDAVQAAVTAGPAFVGLVASHKRGAAVLGYLADRGVAADALARVRTPVGIDLGRTSHREIAVAVLAELVQLRASGALAVAPDLAASRPADAVDPICGMTVPAGPSGYPFEYDGVRYHFCCPGCRSTFESDPAGHVPREARC